MRMVDDKILKIKFETMKKTIELIKLKNTEIHECSWESHSSKLRISRVQICRGVQFI